MPETTTPRLMAAAKEFNIGKDTLVDFLAAKGFSRDDLKPSAKLTEDMYRALQSEFQSDKVAKLKSDQIDLPKGSSAETRKRKEEETISFNKKETKKPAVVEEVKVQEPQPEPVIEVAKPEVKTPEPVPEVELIVNIEAPEIAAPKVLDKIDLSTIDSSTGPKKTVKKPKQEKAKPARQKTEPVLEKPLEEEIVPEELEEELEQPPMIENIKADKLEGPKILGKIQLPLDSETRPKANEEKRKRKRIPIEKKQGDSRGVQREGFNRESRPAQ